jgi:hypothetical protein
MDYIILHGFNISLRANVCVLNEQYVIVYKYCEYLVNTMCSNVMMEFHLTKAVSKCNELISVCAFLTNFCPERQASQAKAHA